MAESLPMMPWYPGDFIRSTRGWSVTARGVYRELLDAQWDMGSLPADTKSLRGMIGATPAEWKAGWSRCADKFPVCADDVRRNPVLEHHRERALRALERKAAGGKATAAKRWGSDSQASSSANSLATAELITKRVHPSPSLNQTYRSSGSSLPQQGDSDDLHRVNREKIAAVIAPLAARSRQT